jgi:DNA-directed RNA polymerase subunit M/transcription elongation factor TFIIS
LKFCRKCGGLLVPKGGGEEVLVCQVCGGEEKAEGSDYRMVRRVEERVRGGGDRGGALHAAHHQGQVPQVR